MTFTFSLKQKETKTSCGPIFEPLSNKQRIEVFLWHVGDPGFQTGVGEDMGIHQSTVSRTFTTVVEAIDAKADIWIQFLVDPADFQATKDDWQNKLHFHAQSVHLTTHMCKFSNQGYTEMNKFVAKDMQPLMFRQLMMLLKDLQVSWQIGQDLYMIAEFGRTQTWELVWQILGQMLYCWVTRVMASLLG